MGKPTFTEKEIEKAFFTLLEAKSLENITVQEIAKEAGVSRATFYRYNKDILSIFDNVIKRDLAIFEETVTENNFSEKLVSFINFIYIRRTIILHIGNSKLSNSFSYSILRLFRILSKKYMELKSDQSEEQNETEAERISYEMFGRFVVWILSGMKDNISLQLVDCFSIH